LTEGGGPEYAESSGTWNTAPRRFGTACGVIDQQQHVTFLLREKNGRSLAWIELPQSCIVLRHSSVAHLQPCRV
jgi:hypothetical protein